MTRSWRFSTLADRHRALGSKLEDWSGMGTAWSYSRRCRRGICRDPHQGRADGCVGPEEGPHHRPARRASDRPRHDARRGEDLSRQVGLCLHAERSRQIHRRLHHLPHQPELLDGGARLRHRPRGIAARRRRAATCRSASTTICTTCRCRARSPSTISQKHVPGIRDLPYFHHMQTQLFGLPVMISRTGYTGERGYEIFCRGQDAGDDLGPHPRRRQGHGHHSLPLHHARHAARRKLPAVLSLRQFAEIPVRRTKAPATRCGSSASTSPSAPARPASAAPRSTTG